MMLMGSIIDKPDYSVDSMMLLLRAVISNYTLKVIGGADKVETV